MLRINVSTHGKSLRQVATGLDKYWFELQAELAIVGEQTHAFMINFIQANKKRPPGPKNTLEDAISYNFYSLGYTAGFSIGEVMELNAKAPYWYTINYGGSMFVGKPTFGYFFPGEARPSPGASREGRWQESAGHGGRFKMVPKKPIMPMNFIQNTNHILGASLARMIAKAKSGKI